MPKITIDFDACSGCFTCISDCPSNVYEEGDGKPVIANPDDCVECQACVENCPESAITVEGD